MILTAPVEIHGEAGSVDHTEAFHEPVMVDEVLEHLLRGGTGPYVDGTVGGGGHARAILEACPSCTLLAVDRDPTALEAARETLAPYGDRVRFLEARFDRALDLAIDGAIDGILDGAVDGDLDGDLDRAFATGGLAGALLDLGVSSRQIDASERGFTFRRGAPLVMRMGGEEESGPDAAEILNTADPDRLARIFRELGEERRAHRLAREVVRRRATEPFEISDQLVAAIATALGRAPTAQDKARIFQALRIAVNEELESLEAALPRLRDALRSGGVLVMLSYHSLEDRMVKRAFREWSRSCVCPPRIPVCRCRGEALGETLTRSPLRPSDREVERNPRARSALLRAWRKAP